MIVKQVKHYDRKNKRIELAKQFVSSAIFHILRNLKYYNAPSRGKNCQSQIDRISALIPKVERATAIDELMGIEGNVRESYYGSLNEILELEIAFEGRTRQPPTNPINALISFGNSMIYTSCLTEIYRTQLNPTISFLHEPGARRFSLSLDLSEIFKPLIADRLIFRLLNRKQIQESKHFDMELGSCYLNEAGRKIFLKEFDSQLRQTIKHPRLKRKVSYRRLMRLECYKLIKHLTEMEKYEALRAWW